MRRSAILVLMGAALSSWGLVGFAQPLSGNYDVGGGNNDFVSPVTAANALVANGVSGAVTFNIYNGTYDGQVDLPGTIVGMGASNPITFQNAPGQAPVITSTSGCGFYLTGADYITIQGLTIANYASHGIYNYYSGTDSSTFNRFIGNTISNVQFAGHYGIYLRNATDCQVLRNWINGNYWGIFDYRGKRILIADNMISNTGYHGIREYFGTDNSFYYNSVYTTSPVGTGTRAALYLGYSVNTVVKNNILYQGAAGGPTTAKYAIILTPYPMYATVSDYNDLYAPNVNVGLYEVARQTLANWQAATGLDAHSISHDPNFVSIAIPGDLHINEPSPVIGAGTPIAGVTDDFDGNARDPVTPDIGADELAPAGPPPEINIVSHSLTPAHPEVYPGGTFTARYQIENTGTVSIPAQLDLRYRAPNTSYGRFQPYAVETTIAPGTTWYQRSATIQETAQPGNYAVSWYLLNQNGGLIDNTGYISNQLTVLPPLTAPNITISPSSYNFLNVQTGSLQAAAFRISNMGGQDLNISSIQFSEPLQYRLSIPPSYPVVLGGNENLDITVVFQPTRYGSIPCVMTVNSNDPDTPSLNVQLLGTGMTPGPPALWITDVVAFSDSGNIPPLSAEDATIEIEITNVGNTTYTGNLRALVQIWDVPNYGNDGFWVWLYNAQQMRDATWFEVGTPPFGNPSLSISGLQHNQTHLITLTHLAQPGNTFFVDLNYKFTDPHFSDRLVIELYEGNQLLAQDYRAFEVDLNTFEAWKSCLGEIATAMGPNVSGIHEAFQWATEKVSLAYLLDSFFENLDQGDVAGTFADLQELTVEVIGMGSNSAFGFIMGIIEGVFNEFNNNGCFAAWVGTYSMKHYVNEYLNNLLTEIYGPFVANFFTFIIGCPVDVQLSNSRGEVIASISSDGVSEVDQDSLYVFMAGECKVISVVASDEYSLEVTGTQYGNFNLSIFQHRADGTFAKVTFDSVSSEPNSIASLTISQSTTDFELDIDRDGNGTIDTTQSADSIGVFDSTPPDSFSLNSPANGAILQELSSIAFDWEDTEDPISPTDTIRYKFLLDNNPYFIAPTIADSLLTSEFILNDSLMDNTTYYWKVIAVDGNGLQRVCDGGHRSFSTNTVNDIPSITLLTPPSGGSVADSVYVIMWQDQDPDDNAAIRLFYDTDSLGFNGSLITPDTIWEDEESDYNIWITSEIPSGNYYVYAEISDHDTSLFVYSNGPLTVSHERVPQAIHEIIITRVANSILLQWSPVVSDTSGIPVAISYYVIYASSSVPFFEPTSSDSIGFVTRPDSTYIDLNALTLPKRFYNVKAVIQ
jgi:parallel beta-helix repeat protein